MVQKQIQSYFAPAPRQTLSVQGKPFTDECRVLAINCHNPSGIQLTHYSCAQLFCAETEQDTLQEVSMSPPSVEPVATLLLQVFGSNDGDSDSLSDQCPESPEKQGSVVCPGNAFTGCHHNARANRCSSAS